jgi:hypothetical protein
MEGLGGTNKQEEEKTLGREEKVREAERKVQEMFGAGMEARGTVMDRIRENPSFGDAEERGF